MNNNFKKIMKECYVPVSERDGDNEYDMEKFAELIIEECIVLAKRERIRNGSDTEHNQAVSKVIESIKQHFGV